MDWISGILGLIIPLVTWLLKNANASDENKKRFFEWVRLAGEDMGSVKLHKYGDDQLKWLAENPWKETT